MPFGLCEIFNVVDVGICEHLRTSLNKKRIFHLQQDPVFVCCIVVHVMLPVIRLSLYDDDV